MAALPSIVGVAVWCALGLLAVAVGLAVVVLLAESAPSDPRLGDGLAGLGDMSGRTEVDFVNAIGLQPTSISTIFHGQRLLQWEIAGQRLVVLFTPDYQFLRITHRHGV